MIKIPQFRGSMSGMVGQSIKPTYMDYLQSRNKSILFTILSGEDIDDSPMIIAPERDTAEEKRGERAIRTVISKVMRHSGISDILPFESLGRLQGTIERAQSRLFQDIRMQLAHISLPLERIANDVVFRLESLINQQYVAAGIGSLIGGGIGYYFLGPLGGTVGTAAGGVFGAIFGEYAQDIRNFYSGGTVPGLEDISWEELSSMTQQEIIEFVENAWTDLPPGTPSGGLPRTIYQGYAKTQPKRPRQIIDMTNQLYGRKRI